MFFLIFLEIIYLVINKMLKSFMDCNLMDCKVLLKICLDFWILLGKLKLIFIK